MLLTNLISLLPLLAGSYAAPLPGITEDLIVRSEISDANTAACPNFCGGTAYNASLQHDYVCGDPRLGPKRLPERIPLGDLVNTYDRFGGLCPGQFLAKWFDASTGYYIYPPDNGFQLNNAGATIQGFITLPVGFLLDRFGSEYGTYTSPQGAPYMQRALPPSNLDTPQSKPTYPYNYHVYNVTASFTVNAGPIAGWFGQPGQGVQYQMSQNVLSLIASGNLARVALSD